jgi:hypothetical protein
MSHSHNIPVKLDGYQASNDPTYFIDGYVSSTSFNSAPVKVGRKWGYSLTLSCPATGTPSGTVKLQGCNDQERILDVADSTMTNWFDLNGASSAVSGASVICIEDRDPGYRWIRVVYTASSGSITATIHLHTKQID